MSLVEYAISNFGILKVGYTGELIMQFHMYPAERISVLELSINGSKKDLMELVPNGWELYVSESEEAIIAPDGIKKAILGNPKSDSFVPYALHEIFHIQRIEECKKTDEKPAPSYTEFLKKEVNINLRFEDILKYMTEEYNAWTFSIQKLEEYRISKNYLRDLKTEIETALLSYIDLFSDITDENLHLINILERNSGMKCSEMRTRLLEENVKWKKANLSF